MSGLHDTDSKLLTICFLKEKNLPERKAKSSKKMVRPTGFEPMTYSSGGYRSIQLSYGRKNGVSDGDRTHDHRSHNPVLYQLSYAHHIEKTMARLRGLEPLTYGLEVRCSILLSYRRRCQFGGMHGRGERI